jgi:acyl transferase domain-containing protein/NAD(P)-dependent dehydrogenase (short-subunit alcohol dehydrogenase family)/aryl carrier-like protein
VSRGSAAEPVAILGAGLRLPGGLHTLPAWWDALVAGRDLVGPVPPDRWDPVRWGTPPAGAFLEDPYRFDAAFFGISPREAADMDPAQRLLLEVAWEALEQAGRAPDALGGSRTGVWVGIGLSDWSRRHFGGVDPERVGPHAGTGSFLSVAAGRIAYALGLQGPALAVDTACSSSLVALHLAVQSLRRGEVDLALAGGASLLLHPMPSVYFGRLGALSADGRCRTFDAAASGYGRGEGVGLLALARLSDALGSGMPLLGVIRGTAVNQDGRTSGLTAPSGAAQQAVVRAALADAGADPAEVAYVEAHGTGTPLGDPVEVDALRAVFLPRAAPLHLGSAKTNLGHLETAAGVAGVLKAALVLRHGVIPPHLHLRTPNPRLNLAGVVIDTVAAPLPPGALVGVSSFGLSGTNAHVVLAPPPPPAPPADPPGIVVVPVSGRTASAARATAARWADALPDDLAGVAGAAARRAALPHRAAVVAATREDLAAGLRAVSPSAAPRRAPVVAFLCSGQGSQLAGMGLALARADRGFAAALRSVAAAVDAATGQRPLLEVLADGDALADTRWTQPALFALHVALAAWWRERGVVPDLLVGHSIGELSAATLAGVFSVDDGARLAVARGRCLGALPAGGGMWAVLAPEAEVRARLGDAPLDVAAVNHPGETVLAGRRVDWDAAAARLSGLEVRPLAVSHAFHSRWVEPALAPFEAAARGIEARPPQVPVVSAVDGRPLGARAVDPGFWRDHVRAPVRFADALAAAADEGATVFVELSARPVLGGLVERVLPTAVRVSTLRPPLDEARAAAEALGAAWVAGLPVALSTAPGVTDLPPGVFEGERHFLPDPTPLPAGLPLWRPVPSPRAGPPPAAPHAVVEDDPVEALLAFAKAVGSPAAEPLPTPTTPGPSAPGWGGGVTAPDTLAGHAVHGAFLSLAAERPDLARGFVRTDRPDEETVLAPATAGAGALDLAGGSTLVTGVTGGLGPALLRWLAARGARSLVVVSRTGRVPPLPEGVVARGVALDLAADPAGLGEVAAAIPDLVAVVHAAGATDDAPFGSHDAARLRAVLAPKVDAAAAVDRATRGRGLRLFLALSSAAAWVGTPGQAPYAAANRALEFLVRARAAAGERAHAVALPPVAGVGLADAPPAQVARWTREGTPPAAVGDVIAALDRAVAGPDPVVLAAGFDWVKVRAARPFALAPPAAVAPSAAVAPPTPRAPGPAEESPGSAPADLRATVAEAVRSVLGHPPGAALDPSTGLFDLGMDSVTAIDLRRRLEAATGRALPATFAIDHPSIDRLVAALQPAVPTPVPHGFAPVDTREPIAIVGWSCRLPGGIEDPEALWALLRAGGQALGPVPADRFDPALLGAAPRTAGWVRALDRFDPAVFGLSPAEARALDPQHRLLLEAAWAALEDAGLPVRADGAGTGVWVAIEPGEYARRLAPDDPYAITGNQPSMASGRLSYVFGFDGPSVSVDTACSSGLVALAQAVRELRAGACRRALVAGVNAITGPEGTLAMAALGALSPRGRCRPFDAEADGYVRGEGCVALVLEPLSVALAAGRRVLGVIEGVAVGHDGASAGLTVPNGPAQAAVIRAALRDAGRAPAEVDAIECHGTGTALGDPIEWGALAEVFAERSAPLPLGAAKASVGHLEAAAGLVGVLSALLRLRHAEVPPIAGLGAPNPALAPTAALRLPTAAEPATLRRVGVSAFGIGGTDAHVVLARGPEEEAPAPPPDAGPWLLALSARTEAQVRATAARWAALTDLDLPAAQDTTFARRPHEVRAVVLAADRAAALAGMRALAAGEAPVGPGAPAVVRLGAPPAGAALAELRAGSAAWAAGWDAAAGAVGALREPGEALPLADVLLAAWALREALAADGVALDGVSAAPGCWPAALVVAGVTTLPAAAKVVVALDRARARPAGPERRAAARAAFAGVMLRTPSVPLLHPALAGDAARSPDAWAAVVDGDALAGEGEAVGTLGALRALVGRAWVRGRAAPAPRGPRRVPVPPTAWVGPPCGVPHPSLRPPLPRWRVVREPATPSLRPAPRAARVVGGGALGAALAARLPPGDGLVLDLRALDPRPADPVAAAEALVLDHARLLREAPAGAVVVLVTRAADADPVDAALGGLAATAAVEAAHLVHLHVDLPPGPVEPAVLELVARLDAGAGAWSLRDGRWGLARLAPEPAWAPGGWTGPILVSGITGGVGRALAAALAAHRVLGLARALPPGVEGLAGDLATLDGPALAAAWARAGLPTPATVVHAAGAPADAALDTLDAGTVTAAFAARVRGALALRAAFPEARHLAVGSAAAVVGNPGQGAYAAAHAFLGALGGAVALGPVGGDGSAAGVDWGARGVRPLPQERVADAVLAGGVVLDVDWPAWARTAPRVPSLVAPLCGGSGAAPAAPRVPPTSPLPVLRALIRASVAEVLGGAPPADDRGFAEAGLDSLGVVAVARRLGEALHRPVAPALLFDHPTVARLAAALSGAGAPAPAPRPAGRGEVAIVAAALRMPGGAADLDAFHALLASGRDVLAPTPPERWDDARYPELAGRECAWLGWDEVRGFDPDAFGVSPREAAAMDPQHRLLLALAREALERAGLRPGDAAGERTAVFVGAGESGYLDRFQAPGAPRHADPHAGTGNLSAFASGRVSHALGLRGPNLTLNTACSSALVAVHLARRALLDGEATVALAGAVHLMLSPEHARVLARLGATSPTGRCRTFDAEADGYARGEGAAVFVLVRADDARARGLPILALVAGSAVGHDGAASALTAPSGPAQEEVIRAALADAGLEPDDVGLVEAHGTGTPLGDPIEVDALHRVFGDRPADRPLLLGAVKSNVGHLELAAGAASLAKVLGAFAHGVVPPGLHLRRPAEALRLGARGYVAPTRPVPWTPGPVGVSGFGLSGTNAHLVLTPPPAPAAAPAPVADGPSVVCLSAPSAAALAATAAVVPSTRAAAHALLRWRAPGPWRAFAIPPEPAPAVGRRVPPAGRVGFLCTGQGSQAPGMGAGLEAAFPVIGETLAEARDVLGADALAAWGDERIHHTRHTQPALVVWEVALARWWASVGVVPDVVLGHSVGQLAAAVIAGALPFADALRLVDTRARLLASLPEGAGAMAAVDAPADVVGAALVPGVVVAADNHPSSCVISGETAAVEAVSVALAARGLRVSRLAVSHAFHSPLVEPVVAAWSAACAAAPWSPPRIPWLGNLDGRPIDDPAAALAAELRAPVAFRAALGALGAMGPSLLIEVGPHPVLAGLARATLADPPAAVATLRHGEDAVRGVLRAAGEAWVGGADLRPEGLFPGEPAPPPSAAPPTVYGRAPCWLPEVETEPDPVLVEDWVGIDVPRAGFAGRVVGDGPLASGLRLAVAAGDPAVHVFEGGAPDAAERALAAVRAGARAVVTVGATSGAHPELLGVHGLLRSLAAEDPRRAPRVLDVDPGVGAERVAAALAAPVTDVRVTSDGVLQRVLAPGTLPASPLAALPVTLITGGLSGVGLAVAKALRARGAPGLVLVSRRAPDGDVAAWVGQEGPPVRVVRGDVADPRVVDEAVAAAEALAGGAPIGVLHAAGALADKPFDALTGEDLRVAAAGKVQGFRNLDARVGEVAFFGVFGAGAAVLGTPGQGAYAAANAALTGFCRARAARGARVTCLHWGAWDEVGMAARLDPAVRRRRAERGLGALSVARGTGLLLRALSAPGGEWAILPTDWPRYVAAAHGGVAPPLLAALVPAAPVGPPAPERTARERLAALPLEARADAARAEVDARVRRVLGRTEALDPGTSLFAAGLDSLLAIELKNALADAGFDVPVVTILAEPTVRSLAAAVEAQLPAPGAPAAPAAEPPPVSPVVSHAVAFALGLLFVVVGYLGTAWLAGYAE